MSRTVEIPLELLEEVAQFEFPSTTQEALERLMDKNNEGQLSEEERRGLQALVDLNEKVALLRGRASLALQNAT